MVTYLSMPNIFYTSNEHIGVVYALTDESSSLGIENHKMSFLIQKFDPKSGYPHMCFRVIKWPLIKTPDITFVEISTAFIESGDKTLFDEF